MNDAQPFAGITVVEFGQFIAVPYAAQLMADGGATVIKVESPEGDPSRTLSPLAPGESRHFAIRNRGKRSLPIRLDHPGARKVLDALVARADVVLTNMRPGLAAQLGLDFESLSTTNPRIVVGDVTGFGNQGPDAGLAGMDLVIQARSGLMASNGRTRDGLPISSDSPLADYMCAALVAFGVSSALLRRERTGRGGKVDVSLLMAALVLQNNILVRNEERDGPVHATAKENIADARKRGASYLEQVALQPNARSSVLTGIFYRTYATKDSVIGTACVSPALQRRLLTALSLVEADGALPQPSIELQHRLEALFATRTTAEWKVILDAAGVPGSAVFFSMELLNDPQTVANGMFFDVDHHTLGPTRMLASPVAIDGDGFAPAPPTPPFGSDTIDILVECGFTPSEADGLVADGVVISRP